MKDPPPPPPDEQQTTRQVGRWLALALALAISVMTSVGPGLGESPKAQNETKVMRRTPVCPQDYRWIAFEQDGKKPFGLSVLG